MEKIDECEKIIYKIISKYTYYFDKDDLYQVGIIGVINAYHNYQKDSNVKFSTYAYFYILGEVKKYVRESNLVKVSKELVKLNVAISKAKTYLVQKLNREPTNFEISLFLEIDEAKIDEAINANMLIESLDKDDDVIYNTVGYDEKEYNCDIMDLKCELDKLDVCERRLINNRYSEGLTQRETSEVLGISQVKVSRMENKILTRLRTRLM